MRREARPAPGLAAEEPTDSPPVTTDSSIRHCRRCLRPDETARPRHRSLQSDETARPRRRSLRPVEKLRPRRRSVRLIFNRRAKNGERST